MEDLKDLFWWGVGLVLVLTITVAAGWCIRSSNVEQERIFAPKEEAIRRQTFEQSKAYRDGMIRDLQAMQFEYATVKPEQRVGLADLILHRAVAIDERQLPPDLAAFLQTVRHDRNQETTP